MVKVNITRTIAAPVDLVFKTVADINQFSQVIPDIVNVEFLSDIKEGLGTRFRETRVMKGKEASTELEITDYVENSLVRLVADSHGTIWDTIFEVEAADKETKLKMYMEGRPYKFLPKIVNPLISRMIKKAIEGDIDRVKEHCEKIAKG